MPNDSSLQRLCLIIIGLSLAVIVSYYGVPEIVQRITLAVERGRAEAIDARLRNLGESSDVFRLVAKRVAPAVANVSNMTLVSRPSLRRTPGGRIFLDSEQGLWPQGQGSGFVIDSRGYIVTNRHVVRGASEVRVRFANGLEQPARIVGSDHHTDLAVLQVPAEGLVAVEFGDSDQVEVGDWVLAVGNPFGLEQSVTAGIVSAKGRSNVIEKLSVQDFLQTDAAINPGNSGGPLVDLKGQVVGVNSAIWSRSGGYEGIGFAIPSKIARSVVEQLIATGQVTRAWLGVSSPRNDEDAVAAHGGVLISEVLRNSPAERAGVRPGDEILAIDGRAVRSFEDMRSRVVTAQVGSTLKLTVARGQEKRQIEVTVEEQPAGLGWFEEQFGIGVRDVDPDLAQLYALPRDRGVWITRVERGLAADREGLEPGHIIVSVNRQEVRSVLEFLAAVQGADMRKGVLVGVMDLTGSHRLVVLGN